MSDSLVDLGSAAVTMRSEFSRLSREPDGLRPEVFSPDFMDADHLSEEQARDSLEEMVQALDALGYPLSRASFLGEDFAKLSAPARTELKAALRAYYKDAESFEDDFEYVTAPDEWGPPVQATQDEVLTRLLRDDKLIIRYATVARLRAATALDGNLIPKRLPADGESSLLSRVIEFRLRLFGFYRAGKGQAYGKDHWQGLRAAAWMFTGSTSDKPKAVTLLSMAGMLGDIRRFARTFVVTYKSIPICIPQVTRKDSRIKVPTAPVRAPRTQKKLHKLKIDVASWFATIWNSVGTRALQIALWTDGYYLGTIDGEWGPLSHAALTDAASQEGIDFMDFLMTGKQGRKHRLFNGADIITTLLDLSEEDPGESIDDAINQVNVVTSGWEPEDWEEFSRKVEDANGLQHSNPERLRYMGLGAFRRGVAKLRARLMKLGANIFEKIKKGVKSVIKRVRGLFRKLTKLAGPLLFIGRYLFRAIRGTMRTAAQAMRRVVKLVCQIPYLTTHADQGCFIITRPLLDQDHMQFTSPGLTPDLLTRHFQTIQGDQRALDVCVALGIKVIKALTLPHGGIKLALEIAKSVWNFFKGLHQDKKTPLWRLQMYYSY